MIAERKYLKKIPILNEKSSPEARAQRLRRLRNLANLTREQMCEQGLMNINTYKGWEIARYGGLPLDGAERVLARIAEEGVLCSLDWLLHEIGSGPQIQQDFFNFDLEKNNNNQFIINEIALFRTQYKQTMDCRVKDEGLLPFYYPGDYVAGVKYSGRDISKLIGKFCIVETVEGKVLTRQLLKGHKKDLFNLVCCNEHAEVKNIVEYSVVVICAAEIIRHYRK